LVELSSSVSSSQTRSTYVLPLMGGTKFHTLITIKDIFSSIQL
jgi:hypothetical protein